MSATSDANGLRREVVLYGENTFGPYTLFDQFILIGSDSVFINESLVSREKYQIDYEMGTILFAETISEKDKIHIRYQRIPALNLEKRYRLYSLEEAYPIEPLNSGEKKDSGKQDFLSLSASDEEELMVSGSKSIGFSVGSEQGLGIEQVTRLNLAGTIAGVNLEASLSDQSSPIPPEGVTKELAELDKILINVKKGEWLGVFGDYDLAMDFGSFGSKKSRVIGAQVKGSLAKTNLFGFYARPKGKFQRLLIKGEDGVQGPYRLNTNGNFIAIVPASEIVYLNGEKMTRGFDEDYTIDYTLGEITFTNKRIITDQSRIYVTFEYTFDTYDRSTIGVSASYSISPLTIGIKNFQEADNQNRSLVYDFVSSEIETLSAIGDDTGRAWLDGGRHVGFGQGEYRKVNTHYQYAGLGKGDYQVFFTYVGDSLGDYIYQDSCYLYTGPNSGQYVAKRRIILPEKHEIYLVDLGLNTESALGGFGLGIEGSMSRKDNNLFSSFADEDNNGFAYSIQGSYQKATFAAVSYKRRFTPKNFFNPNRSEAIDFAYDWGDILESERLASDEITSFIKPFPNTSIHSEIGWLINQHKSLHKRFKAGAKIFWAGYEVSRVSDILRQNLNIKPRIKFLAPEFLLFKEERKTFRWLTINPALGFKPAEAINSTFSIDLTSDERKDTLIWQWQKESIRKVYRIDLKTLPWRDLSLDGICGLQTKSYQEIAGADWQQYFADFSLNYSLINKITSRFDYHHANKQVQQKLERYIKVDSGSGDYKRNPETNEFYPDPKGDYRRVIEPTGKMNRSQEQNWQGNFDLSILKPISLIAFFNFNQERTDTKIIYQTYNHETRLEIIRQKKGLGVKAIYLTNNYHQSFDDRYTNQKNWQNQNSLGFQIDLFSELNLNTRFEFNLRERRQIILNRETERKFLLEPFLGYGLGLAITLSQTWRNISYSYYPDFELKIIDFGLKRRFEYKKNTVVITELIFTNCTASIDKLPFEIALNYPLGLTKKINLSLDQMISKELVFSAGYSFFDRPDLSPEHSISANLRAYF